MDDERSVVVLGAVVGAALGGLAGYLFLTEGGAAVRRDLVARMNALAHELSELQGAVGRARTLVADTLQAAREAAEEHGWDSSRQRSPS
jgi:hypothetical protein